MNILVLCTGNVARSPALAGLLQARELTWDVRSAAMGDKAKAGRRMAKPMRGLLAADGLGTYAETHRSQRADAIPEGWPEYVVALTPKHRAAAAERWPRANIVYWGRVEDPAWGGQAAYEKVYRKLQGLAAVLSLELV